jgi:hypothetical protein
MGLFEILIGVFRVKKTTVENGEDAEGHCRCALVGD